MTYSFEAEEAVKYGVSSAIILQHFKFWLQQNKANEKNQHDGRTWTYNSIKAFQEIFPFWSDKQIRGSIQKLIDKGVLLTGNYNKITYDRTLWYAFENEEAIFLKSKLHFTLRANGSPQKGEPIPDIIPDIKPDVLSILKKWNNQGIRRHSEKVVTSSFKKKHLDKIKLYGLPVVLDAIENYGKVVTSRNHYFNYKWNLWDFITRGLDNFIPAADPLNNYRSKPFLITASQQGEAERKNGYEDENADLIRRLKEKNKAAL